MFNFFSDHCPPKRALIIKLRYYGDVLLASPVFTVLKKNWPSVEVDALVYDDTRDMLTNHPYIDQIYTIGRIWRKQGWLTQFSLYHKLLKKLKTRKYDILINLTEHWQGARLARCLKPLVSVGFKPDHCTGFARRYWIKSFTMLYPAIQNNTRHMVEVNLDALRRIGIHPQCEKDKNILFMLNEAVEASIIQKLLNIGLNSKSYILIHPTARWKFKMLNIDKLALTIDQLASRGLPIVLSAAPSKEDMAYMKDLCGAITQPVYDLSGQLNLKELGSLIKHARLYFGMDSMPMHLASAVGTPIVAIFGPTGTIKWSPWKGHYCIVMNNFTCQPCGKAGCGDSSISDCITAITPQQILSTIDMMLMEIS